MSISSAASKPRRYHRHVESAGTIASLLADHIGDDQEEVQGWKRDL